MPNLVIYFCQVNITVMWIRQHPKNLEVIDLILHRNSKPRPISFETKYSAALPSIKRILV